MQYALEAIKNEVTEIRKASFDHVYHPDKRDEIGSVLSAFQVILYNSYQIVKSENHTFFNEFFEEEHDEIARDLKDEFLRAEMDNNLIGVLLSAMSTFASNKQEINHFLYIVSNMLENNIVTLQSIIYDIERTRERMQR